MKTKITILELEFCIVSVKIQLKIQLKKKLGKKWTWFQMIPLGEWIRMIQFSFQTDIILISYKSSLSQMIGLIIAMDFVQKSSQSDKFSLGFDQFKVL